MPTDNRSLAIRWFNEVWNERRDASIDELADPNLVGHMEGRDVDGPAEWKAVRDGLLVALPDLRMEIQDTVAEGEQVVVRWLATGTHTGTGLGLSPTGKRVRVRGVSWMRFANGRLVEGWDSWDITGFLTGLGAPAGSRL